MQELVIKNVNVVTFDNILSNHNVYCRDGKIIKIYSNENSQNYNVTSVIDAANQYLVPGFIDLHIHGLHNYLIDNGTDDLNQICRILPRYGVTAFLPTITPMPQGLDVDLLTKLAQFKSDAAHIFGYHMEGPYLALPGSLSLDAIGRCDKERVINLKKAAEPYKLIFSISPEFEGILDLIATMKDVDTPVFITHTGATVEQTQAAIDAGACHATHFYNVFPQPKDRGQGLRTCGTVEVILTDDRISVDFIMDGEHVELPAVKMMLLCKGFDKVCLITDSNVGSGFPPGKYIGFNNMEVEYAYPGAPARITSRGGLVGALAGSGLTMDIAVRNSAKMLDLDLCKVIRMASTNPARVLGLDNVKGKLQEGYDADMVLLDKQLRVVKTWIGGKCLFDSSSNSSHV